MTTAAIYCRISRDATGEGLGVERQETECRALAARLGLDVSAVYVDNDLSAYSGKVRPEFERMLAAAPPAIVAYHQDRLLRLTADLERVIALDVPVYTVSAGTLDLTNAAGRAVARTVAAWSQYESEQKATRQRSANAQAAAAGRPYWRRRPFGWNLDGTLVPEEAQAIVVGCERVLAGWSLAAVTRAWNEAGLRTPALAKPQKAGKFPLGDRDWTTQGVRRVLMAHRIAGIREHDGTETAGTWQPAVSEDTWRAVRSLLSDPARSSHKVRTGKVAHTLLAGIATCALCGGPMHTDTSRGRKFYRCTTNRHLVRKVDAIDDAVVERTARLLTLPGVFEAAHEDDTDTDRQALLTERRALMHRRDVELPQALAAGLTVAQVATANNAVVARLAEVDAALESTTPDSALLSAVQDATTGPEARTAWLGTVWAPMPLEARRAVVRALWLVQVPGPSIEPTPVAERLMARAGVPADWWQ